MLDAPQAETGWGRRIEVPAEWLARRSRGAVAAGVDLETLFQRCLIAPQERGLLEITTAQHLLLPLTIVDLLDDETHGLGRTRTRKGTGGVLLCCILECADLESAIGRLARYCGWAGETFQVSVRTSRRAIDIAVKAVARDDEDGALLEEVWALVISVLLGWFAGRPLPVTGVQLRVTEHPSIGKSHPMFGAPLTYGPVTALRLRPDCLSWPRAAPAVENPMIEMVDRWLDAAPRPRPQPTRARHKAAVVETAVTRLRATSDSLADIAEDLGYAEVRSLRRLIKDKTGRTPQAWRAMGAPALTPDAAVAWTARQRVRDLLARAWI